MSKHIRFATKAMIKNKDGKYLVIHKSGAEDVGPNDFDIPGGGIEFGEDIEESLKREVKEEAGIDIDIKKPSRTWGYVKDDLHLVGVTFLTDYVAGEVALSGEHDDFGWLTREEVLSGDYPEWLKQEFLAIGVDK